MRGSGQTSAVAEILYGDFQSGVRQTQTLSTSAKIAEAQRLAGQGKMTLAYKLFNSQRVAYLKGEDAPLTDGLMPLIVEDIMDRRLPSSYSVHDPSKPTQRINGGRSSQDLKGRELAETHIRSAIERVLADGPLKQAQRATLFIEEDLFSGSRQDLHRTCKSSWQQETYDLSLRSVYQAIQKDNKAEKWFNNGLIPCLRQRTLGFNFGLSAASQILADSSAFFVQGEHDGFAPWRIPRAEVGRDGCVRPGERYPKARSYMRQFYSHLGLPVPGNPDQKYGQQILEDAQRIFRVRARDGLLDGSLTDIAQFRQLGQASLGEACVADALQKLVDKKTSEVTTPDKLAERIIHRHFTYIDRSDIGTETVLVDCSRVDKISTATLKRVLQEYHTVHSTRAHNEKAAALGTFNDGISWMSQALGRELLKADPDLASK